MISITVHTFVLVAVMVVW